jgi:hypothetical protein
MVDGFLIFRPLLYFPVSRPFSNYNHKSFMIVLINHGSRSVLMSFIEKALSQEIIIKQYQYIGRRSINIILLLEISTANQHKITSSR